MREFFKFICVLVGTGILCACGSDNSKDEPEDMEQKQSPATENSVPQENNGSIDAIGDIAYVINFNVVVKDEASLLAQASEESLGELFSIKEMSEDYPDNDGSTRHCTECWSFEGGNYHNEAKALSLLYQRVEFWMADHELDVIHRRVMLGYGDKGVIMELQWLKTDPDVVKFFRDGQEIEVQHTKVPLDIEVSPVDNTYNVYDLTVEVTLP